MKGIPFTLLITLPLLVTSCSPQRTVVSESQSYSFGKQWASQTGDRDALQQTFASGFEIDKEQGRAVATGNGQNPFDKREFAVESFDRKSFAESGKKSGDRKQVYDSDKKFSINPFKTDTARESGSVSPYATADANLNQTFETSEWRNAGDKFDTSASKDADKSFAFWKGRNSRMDAPTNHVEAQGSMDQQGNETGLSVDEVRRMLSPEEE